MSKHGSAFSTDSLQRSARHVCVLAWLLVLPLDARALDIDTEPPAYRATIDDGLREYQAGNFAEARALFGRAHALFPNARTLRGMGMAAFELHRYGECIGHLEAALASDVKPLTDALRAEAEALRARALHFVARVSVIAAPADAALIVDGNPIDDTGKRQLVLDIGDHHFEFSAAGYATERRALHAAGGEALVLRFPLTPLAAAASAPASPGRNGLPADDSRRWYRSPWLWSMVGVAVAGAAAGAAVALRPEARVAAPYEGNVPTTEGP